MNVDWFELIIVIIIVVVLVLAAISTIAPTTTQPTYDITITFTNGEKVNLDRVRLDNEVALCGYIKEQAICFPIATIDNWIKR